MPYGATAPPQDEEVTYVGAWFDDLEAEESYHQDRWGPFVRCVLAWVGEMPEWRRHPRPVFEGTSIAAQVWGTRYRRASVEGIFVEVPLSIASRVLDGLRTGFSARGLLEVEQLDRREFFGHGLATYAWLHGDVCLHADFSETSAMHEETGLRFAYLPEGDGHTFDALMAIVPRHEVEAFIRRAVEGAVRSPSAPALLSPSGDDRSETIVLRTEENPFDKQPFVRAMLVLFNLDEAPLDFEELLVQGVARRLLRKSYKNEVILWTWTGPEAQHPNTCYAAITTPPKARAGHNAELFKDVVPHFFEAGEDTLRGDARPLLRWRPGLGFTRFLRGALPPDGELVERTRAAPMRYRHAVVVRAAGDPVDLWFGGLKLENFRGLASFQCKLSRQFNLIIGDNATGKTTILEALAALLRVFADPHDEGEMLREEDVRAQMFSFDVPTVEPQYPAVVEARLSSGMVEEIRRDDQGARRVSALRDWIRGRRDEARKGRPIDLPLVVYYGVSRAHPTNGRQALDVVSPSSRLAGYDRALEGGLDVLPFQRWFKTMELSALQEQRTSVLLEVVPESVRRCIEDCITLRFMLARDEIVVRFRDDRFVPLQQLSDGYRLMLAMVADIAWRCVVLNPHLGPAATDETSGIVLIDEVNLHLHPRWQRHVVEDLRAAFPRLQFIATTHSPFIVQSMEAEEVVNLDAGTRLEYQKASIEDIAEEAMGVEDVQRSRRFQEMVKTAEEYYRLLATQPANEEDVRRLKERLDALMLPFADNPAYVAFLRSESAARGLV